ncbi:MAG: dnaX 1 [Haloplasmataceae bacterium]|jgi:DNA polymerase-3 subunit delta'|nr:dnaX 1 [Haloplasmataceae bacterium]
MSLDNLVKLQPKVLKILINSYKKDRLAHAYLFEGEKGTNKKEVAIEFAKVLYCEGTDKPCDNCINCLRIEHNNHPNVLIIEPENNSIKKEQVIYLQKEYSKTTLEPGPKIYIIEEIDKMSNNASNSILKFIEEPQPNTYTILTTDNLHQILPTIISRCQVLNFQPLLKSQIVDFLLENNIELDIAKIVSQLTNDLSRALEIANGEEIVNVVKLVIDIMRAILSKNENPLIIIEDSQVDIVNNKKLLELFLDVSLIYQRDVEHVKNKIEEIVFINESSFIKKYIDNIDMDKIISNIDHIIKAKINLDYNAYSISLIDTLFINLI